MLSGTIEQVRSWEKDAEWWADFWAALGKDWQQAYNDHLRDIEKGQKK